ncbi:hypothetical protein ACFPOI_24885 [Nonomuraea angiospora]|uniref:Uncharacterized protein n=1 Tax=Nonomuraea angiospora TaxID=46172 RepID=A0ABR9LQP9_9ACTN|nr:hypothetical protein [Nonomuraea angiospora]MBE1582612.1 hypothetical protein [Nonomuraea angiospora]
MRPAIEIGMAAPHRPSRTVQRVPAAVEQSAAEDSRFITVEGS